MVRSAYVDARDRLTALLHNAPTSGGALVTVVGGLATGKTRLLREFAAQAARKGAAVLAAAGSRVEQDLEGGVLDQLLHHAAALDPGGVTATAGLVVEGNVAKTVRGVRDLLLAASADRPLVVCVDDAHLADGLSRRALLHLRHSAALAQVVVVLAESETETDSAVPAPSEPGRTLRLAPLTRAGVAELVGGPGAARVHALTGGNPLLVTALAEDPEGLRGEPGPAFAHAVRACLHRMDPGLRACAEAAAVLGDDANPSLVAALADLSPAAATWALGALERAGLLDADGRYRHPGAAAAVRDDLPVAAAASWHREAAALLYRRGADRASVAVHLLAADRAAADWAVPVLCEAAEQAVAAHDVDHAVRCLELALESTLDPARRLAVARGLVPVLWRVNPAAAAVHLATLRAAAKAGELPVGDVVALVRHFLWHGDVACAREVVGGLNAHPDGIDPRTAAELAVAFQWFHGQVPKPVSEGAAASDDPWSEAVRQITSVRSGGGNPAANAAAEQVLRSCGITGGVELVAVSLLALTLGDAADTAVRWCERLTERARATGAITWEAVLCAVRADIAMRRGEVVAAAASAERALELLPARSWGVFVAYPLTPLLLARTAMGEHDRAAEIAATPVPEAVHSTVFGPAYLNARGHHNLATDRVLAAISDFQACGTLLRRWSLDLPTLVAWRVDLASANLRLGRRDTARDLVRQQLGQTRGLDPRTRGQALRVLAAVSDGAQRTTLLRQAVECLRRCGDRLAMSEALGELSLVHEQLGEFEEARSLARRAVQEAKTCFAGTLPAGRVVGPAAADPAESELASVSDLAHTANLSDSELRVAQMAALGHSNREISRRLYITVSTVEQHLTRAYRKLGVKRRTDLPSGLVVPDAESSVDQGATAAG